MSGGSLGEYGFYAIGRAQVDLRHAIDAGDYSPETVEQLEAIHALMGNAATRLSNKARDIRYAALDKEEV